MRARHIRMQYSECCGLLHGRGLHAAAEGLGTRWGWTLILLSMFSFDAYMHEVCKVSIL